MVRIIRLRELLDLRGKKRSSHYNDVTQGLYTPPVKIGARAVGWPESEAVALQSASIAGQKEEEIRALVKALKAQRRGAA